jgi:pyridoxine/pyridoxamine 5'-phosphate oxidase
MTMTTASLREFINRRGIGVISTISADGAPEAALVELAATADLEIVFHAIETTRKCANLRRDPRIALVVGGWDGPETLQYEGVADEPEEAELAALKELYFASCPLASGRAGWPGLTYFRIRPKWLRFSTYAMPWSVEEMTFR